MAWYILQSSTNLLKTNWFNLTNGVTVSNNLKTITLPATNPAQFFRLFNTN